ncbi:MAG: hypothetical protein ACKVZJ_10155 [Phycisphaerales bacterium]
MFPNARIIGYSRNTGAAPLGGELLTSVVFTGAFTAGIACQVEEFSLGKIASLTAAGLDITRTLTVPGVPLTGLGVSPSVGDRVLLHGNFETQAGWFAVRSVRGPVGGGRPGDAGRFVMTLSAAEPP